MDKTPMDGKEDLEMCKPIRVLIVEDSEDDTILMVRELRKNGFDVVFERVDNSMAMENALTKQEWDIVIADYAMPEFDGISALRLLEKKQVDLPFILVSGAIGEDVAVEAVKAGADDYVMKDNLTRLVSAVKRELKEYENRRKLERMEDAIQILVKSTVVKTGQDAFRRIGSGIRDWLGTDYVCLGQIIDDDKVKVLSMIVDGEFKCGCIYDLKGTLCDTVINDGFCYYPEGAGKLLAKACEQCSKIKAEGYFGTTIRNESGKNIGLLWTASRNKLDLPPRAREVMGIIATKAASEIERMQAEEELQKSEQHHRKLLNSLKEGVYQCEPHVEGVFTWVNQACAEIFGYRSPEEMIGTKVEDIYVNSEDRGRLLEKLEKDGVWKNFESFCKKKNGEQIYTERTSNMIRDEEDKPDCIEGIIRDITERKEMEETIRRHSDELESLVEERTTRVMELERQRMENEKLATAGRMAAQVAHEINNPLSGIKGGFMLIKDSIPKEHKYYDYVGLIDKEVDRITRIVRQMFDLCRPYQGKISEFDPMVPVRDVVNMLNNHSNERCVTVNLGGFDNTVKVTMSEDYFRQILLNIIKNAIEASPRDSVVDVNVKNQNNRLIIMVSDQGEGISDELRSKIFEPFFTTKDKNSGSGLGLGLSTTKGIVEAMGGSLDFTSEKDKGATFIIELPTSVARKESI